jgi:fatty acid amide hydrolase
MDIYGKRGELAMSDSNQSMDSNLTNLSATQLAQRIRSGKISARETVEAHINRIETVNQSLNAVVVPLFEEAMAQAAAADSAVENTEPLGPLHGVPITIKDQFHVAGTQTTLGLLNQVGMKASKDGPLVAKLRKAGAIILGKTNVPQMLIYHESDNPVYGRSNNPWNLERTPGGSSGGEAAIIAVGGSSLGLGGDFGGSIRIPAHFCGIHGLKPTSGRLTNDDNPAHILAYGQEAIVAQNGPMARTVDDLRLAMDVLTTPTLEGTTDLIPPIPWPDPANVSITGLRIGMYTDDGIFPAAPAIRRAVEEAAAALRGLEAKVEPFTPPGVAEAIRLYLSVVSADGGFWVRNGLSKDKPDYRIKGLLQGGSMSSMLRPVVANLIERQGKPHLAFAIRSMGSKSAHQYWQLVKELTAYRQQFLKALDDSHLDALICPPHALPALTHGSGDLLTVYSTASYAVLYNVLGMPAGVVAATRVRRGEESVRSPRNAIELAAFNVEKGSAGLPVGVQVVARHWREDIVLAVMAVLERHFLTMPGYPAHPSIIF